jgi:integrase
VPLTLCDTLCYFAAVQRQETQGDHAIVENHRATFFPAVDSRKRKIRGLWQRNNRYYLQMRVEQGNGTSKPVRIPLEAVNIEEARKEMDKKRTQKNEGTIHQPGLRPNFEALTLEYRESAEFSTKKRGTQENEVQALKRWNAHLGGIRVDWIKPSHLVDFQNLRRAGGVGSRTINLDLGVFNNAMRYAQSKGWVTIAPRLKKLKEAEPKKKPSLTSEAIGKLLEACEETVTKNAKLVQYYLRFLALTGAREQESLLTRKIDVNFETKKVTIGGTGDTKNREFRDVDMSAELEALLREITDALPPDTSYLFPSPQRGFKDIPASSLRESFKLVRKQANLDWVGFHDFRHFFCSTCVMAGIDFMTIAEWVGHKDGGVLIGKVYGHLIDEHKRKAASGLSLLQRKI